MFDHVGIAVSDLAASARFYRTVLGVLGAQPVRADEEIVEWQDWDVMQSDREHPLTRGLHVAFRAPTRAAVDAFWHAGVEAGHRDAGAPGPTPGGDHAAALLDPDGTRVAAVHGPREQPAPAGAIEHLWLGVADLAATRRFYETIAPHAGLHPGPAGLRGEDFGVSLLADGRPVTQHVHLAFSAAEDGTVRAFHAAALAAGYADNGGPGERPAYHPGYYGAFVLDPNGLNVEVVNHNR